MAQYLSEKIRTWKDLLDFAPKRAKGYRVRKPTETRKRYIEENHCFSLDEEGLEMRHPIFSKGTWAVAFYAEVTDPKDKPIVLDEAGNVETRVEFTSDLTEESSQPEIHSSRLMNTLERQSNLLMVPATLLVNEIKELREQSAELSEKLEAAKPGLLEKLLLQHIDKLLPLATVAKDFGLELLKQIRGIPNEAAVSMMQSQERLMISLKERDERMDKIEKASMENTAALNMIAQALNRLGEGQAPRTVRKLTAGKRTPRTKKID